jgi:hypothetical protein
VKEGVAKAGAESMKKKLEEAGGSVELRVVRDPIDDSSHGERDEHARYLAGASMSSQSVLPLLRACRTTPLPAELRPHQEDHRHPES